MYDGENGWAIPSADGGRPRPARRPRGRRAVRPHREPGPRSRFYDDDGDGLPRRWIEMVRHTLMSLGPQVLASRMVRDYVLQLYAPAAQSSRALSADDVRRRAQELAAWPAGCARRGRGAGRPRGVARRRRRPELGASARRARDRRPRRAHARRRARCRSRTGGSTRPTSSSRPGLRVAAAADRRGGRRARWRVRGRGPARAHRAVRLHRAGAAAHALLATPAELGLVALPVESTAYTVLSRGARLRAVQQHERPQQRPAVRAGSGSVGSAAPPPVRQHRVAARRCRPPTS